MREAEPLHHGIPLPLPSAAGATALAQSRLLLALEAILEPAGHRAVAVAAGLVVRRRAHAALADRVGRGVRAGFSRPRASCARRRTRCSSARCWPGAGSPGLLLAMGFATGHIHDFSARRRAELAVVRARGATARALGAAPAAPHLVRLQGPPLRAVVVGMNEQGCSLADRLRAASVRGHRAGGLLRRPHAGPPPRSRPPPPARAPRRHCDLRQGQPRPPDLSVAADGFAAAHQGPAGCAEGHHGFGLLRARHVRDRPDPGPHAIRSAGCPSSRCAKRRSAARPACSSGRATSCWPP